MTLDELQSRAKKLIWNAQDRYDAFVANRFQTHLATAIAGLIVGVYLASLVWK